MVEANLREVASDELEFPHFRQGSIFALPPATIRFNDERTSVTHELGLSVVSVIANLVHQVSATPSNKGSGL